MASFRLNPGSPVASSAPPGVLQAISTGARKRSERPMLVTAMPMPNAHNHELIWSGEAPAAAAA